MSRVFITGVSGQDGSYLSERFLSEGWEVHGLTQSANTREIHEGVLLRFGSLSDSSVIETSVLEIEPDVIINLGAISSVAACWKAPIMCGQVNGLAVATLLQTALTLQERTGRAVRVVQASSAEVFGNAETVPQTEQTPIAPVNPYGAAKAYAQNMVRIYRSRGLFAASAILYNHESPRRPAQFVTRKITEAVARIAYGSSELLSLGTLEVRRDWGWAPDYVDALVRISRAPDPDDFVVATGTAHSIEDFVASAFESAGISDWRNHVVIDSQFVRPAETAEMLGDSSKLRNLLGWQPTISFQELVERMVTADLDRLSGNLKSKGDS